MSLLSEKQSPLSLGTGVPESFKNTDLDVSIERGVRSTALIPEKFPQHAAGTQQATGHFGSSILLV